MALNDTIAAAVATAKSATSALQDDITITNVLGDELTGNTKGEVFRVSTVTAREIV